MALSLDGKKTEVIRIATTPEVAQLVAKWATAERRRPGEMARIIFEDAISERARRAANGRRRRG